MSGIFAKIKLPKPVPPHTEKSTTSVPNPNLIYIQALNQRYLMENLITLPTNFDNYLTIENADIRFTEATEVAERITEAGVEIHPNMDHAAIFCDPTSPRSRRFETTRLCQWLGRTVLSIAR